MTPDFGTSRHSEQGAADHLTGLVGSLEHCSSELLRILGPEEEDDLTGQSWRSYPDLCEFPIVIGEQVREREDPLDELALPDCLVRIGDGVERIEVVIGGIDPRHQIFKVAQEGGASARRCVFDSSDSTVPTGRELDEITSSLAVVAEALSSHLSDVKSWHPEA